MNFLEDIANMARSAGSDAAGYLGRQADAAGSGLHDLAAAIAGGPANPYGGGPGPVGGGPPPMDPYGAGAGQVGGPGAGGPGMEQQLMMMAAERARQRAPGAEGTRHWDQLVRAELEMLKQEMGLTQPAPDAGMMPPDPAATPGPSFR